MEDRECVVCSTHVDEEGGYLELDSGGSFSFAFADEEAPIELWIHYHCLRRAEAPSSAANEPTTDDPL